MRSDGMRAAWDLDPRRNRRIGRRSCSSIEGYEDLVEDAENARSSFFPLIQLPCRRGADTDVGEDLWDVGSAVEYLGG